MSRAFHGISACLGREKTFCSHKCGEQVETVGKIPVLSSPGPPKSNFAVVLLRYEKVSTGTGLRGAAGPATRSRMSSLLLGGRALEVYRRVEGRSILAWCTRLVPYLPTYVAGTCVGCKLECHVSESAGSQVYEKGACFVARGETVVTWLAPTDVSTLLGVEVRATGVPFF